MVLTLYIVAGAGWIRHAAEEVAARRGDPAHGGGEGGHAGHDQGGDLRPLLCQVYTCVSILPNPILWSRTVFYQLRLQLNKKVGFQQF